MSASEADEEKMFAAIGRALSAWASVENELCHLYCVLVNPDTKFPQWNGFWAVVSFEAKLKMTDVVARERFKTKDQEFLDEWNALRDRLSSKNGKRNLIAHGTVIHHRKSNEDWKLFLAPFYHSKTYDRKFNHKKNGTIAPVEGWKTEKEVRDLVEGFKFTSDRIRALFDSFIEKQALNKLDELRDF